MTKGDDIIMKKFHENIWYGTLKECIDELYGLIDFEHKTMPRVDYSAYAPEDAKTAYEAYSAAEGWFGIVKCENDFDSDGIVLLMGHYGGGGIQAVELTDENPEEEKMLLMRQIRNSADDCGYCLLPHEYTVFELE